MFDNIDLTKKQSFLICIFYLIYLLILNGFRGLYSRIGSLYFAHPKGREISRAYYQSLIELAKANQFDEAILAVRKYGIESGKLWADLKDDVLKELSND